MINTNNFIRISIDRRSCNGLCSILSEVFNRICDSIYNNLIPIVDLTNFDNPLFHTTETLGKINPWEYYFKQPTDIVIPSDIACDMVSISIKQQDLYKHNYSIDDQRNIFKKYIRINDSIIKVFNSFLDMYRNQHILGVCIRGTDYVNIKPKAHSIQPSVEQVIDDISVYLNQYKIDKIFVATDESTYLRRLKDKFGPLIIHYQKNFVDNRSNNMFNGLYLNKTYNINYIIKLNKEYLINVLILSKCQYLIMGKTSATIIYNLLRDTKPVSEKIYDFGVYNRPKFRLLPSGFVDTNHPIDYNKPVLLLHPNCRII